MPNSELPTRIESRSDLMALLNATTNYEEKRPRDPAKRLFKLERVERLFAAVGDPQVGPRVLHIAGSKGKGSVARMAAHVLSAQPGAGPVGLYTSPHLQDLAERVMVDGRPAGEAALAEAATALLPYLATVRDTADQPTFFELFTAIAWLVFRDAGCTDVVLETGLGGRLDATNVCAPAACVITSIELEHTRLLGETIAEIAAEKAGIIKPGVPVITTASGEALDVIRRTAAAQDAPLIAIGDDLVIEDVRVGPGAATAFTIDGTTVQIPVAGRHHAGNAAAAHAALDAYGLDEGWDSAFATARLPGVLELVAREPDVRIDGAHTPRSAAATRASLEAAWPGRPYGLVMALLDEKDADAIAAEIVPSASWVVTCRVDSPRALASETLAGVIRAHTHAPVEVCDTPVGALAAARARAGDDAFILAVGSVYLAGAIRDAVGLRPGEPLTR